MNNVTFHKVNTSTWEINSNEICVGTLWSHKSHRGVLHYFVQIGEIGEGEEICFTVSDYMSARAALTAAKNYAKNAVTTETAEPAETTETTETTYIHRIMRIMSGQIDDVDQIAVQAEIDQMSEDDFNTLAYSGIESLYGRLSEIDLARFDCAPPLRAVVAAICQRDRQQREMRELRDLIMNQLKQHAPRR